MQCGSKDSATPCSRSYRGTLSTSQWRWIIALEISVEVRNGHRIPAPDHFGRRAHDDRPGLDRAIHDRVCPDDRPLTELGTGKQDTVGAHETVPSKDHRLRVECLV